MVDHSQGAADHRSALPLGYLLELFSIVRILVVALALLVRRGKCTMASSRGVARVLIKVRSRWLTFFRSIDDSESHTLEMFLANERVGPQHLGSSVDRAGIGGRYR